MALNDDFENVPEGRREKLILDIYHCVAFAYPIPGMRVDGIPRERIYKADKILEAYLDELDIERAKKEREES